MWLLIAAAVAGLAVALLVLIFADKGMHPTARMARCSMGFLVAIVWIMAIADEVVQVLQVCLLVVIIIKAILSICPDIWIYFWSLGCHHWLDDFCSRELPC